MALHQSGKQMKSILSRPLSAIWKKKLWGQNKSLFPAGKFKAFRGTSTKLKLTAERTPLVNKLKIPYIAPNVDLTKVHLVVKKLFAGKIIPAIPLAGRLKHFLNSWNS